MHENDVSHVGHLLAEDEIYPPSVSMDLADGVKQHSLFCFSNRWLQSNLHQTRLQAAAV